jgi:hypothetical protein
MMSERFLGRERVHARIAQDQLAIVERESGAERIRVDGEGRGAPGRPESSMP